ncbi:putative Seipin family protein [Helianthus annuus]|uniref:Putative seipin family n=1 Tax=Helianthus annuus TaxID=4232 RepID=A0A251RV75_HELAN|nr:seipin-2 isoform X2 [Helianthus annuus]KAF5764787.1 putative Seipin family protein [Helianthus annuus]KAJ0451426.1 putative Seipin family protein [Helianthus annuus]KAJ0455931.1 putative Seipin family protein [Helianthus annuus]KAJ0473301.1 putative Seipin family protein [Helianthus annuus]KAJ0648884.1 putative Seipin family protein [Helianthus annuus]
MEMEQQSTFNNTNNNLIDTEFHDALEEFSFLDASTSFEESYQSVSTSDSDIINDEATETATVISDHSPSSPSAAGLRHRRLVSPRSRNEVSQSRFFKKNPEGLIDFDPKGVGKKHKRSCSLKDNEKLNENLSLDSHGSSAITSVSDSQGVHDESTTVDSPNSGPDFLSTLAELGGISGIWGICYNSCVKLINWFQTHESALKLCVQIGWGLLWLAYCGFLLVCLLVPAFVFGAVAVKWIVEEPVQITEQLTFDYTKDTPMAFAPVIYCPDSSFVVNDEKSTIGSFAQSRVVPFGHELKAIVSLVLPESDYNRNLGIFQVRVDFLSSDGKLLASTRKPSMLQFKSEPIRLLSTFVKLAYLLTGYPSETQTLDMNFSGYTEKDVPLSCLRVVIEQRAEFAKGGGVPEIYSASLKLETQFPFLKRMLWYWKGLIYMWISITLFITELLFTLLCCTPVIFPWVRRARGSSINTAAHNKPPG